MEEFKLRDEFIRLGQAMKATGFSDSGVEAKEEILAGNVLVTAETELRRGRKLYDGDTFTFEGKTVKIVK